MTGIDDRGGRRTAVRARGLALTAAGVAAVGLLGKRLAETAWQGWSAVADPQLAGPAEIVAALAASAGLALLAWLVTAVLLSLVSTVAGHRSPGGRVLSRVTGRVAPVVLRNAVAAALGVVVVASPVTAHAAAAPAPSAASVSERAGASDFSPAWLPTTTSRPAVDAPRPTTAGGTSSETEDFRPGWVPTRPLSASDSRARPAAPTAPVSSAPRRAAAADPGDDVVVRRGDTLWSIAARHLGPGTTDAEIALDWPRWFATNRTTVGRDPDRLQPGQRLRPPAAAHLASGDVSGAGR